MRRGLELAADRRLGQQRRRRRADRRRRRIGRSTKSWTRLWRVDVVATLRLSRAVGQRMQQRGRGVILNMGWDQAETGMAGDSGEMFAATKGAVMAATRSLAKSLAPEVRVNCLAPGWIRTEWGEQASDEWQERAEARVAARPLGRARGRRPRRLLPRLAGRRVHQRPDHSDQRRPRGLTES